MGLNVNSGILQFLNKCKRDFRAVRRSALRFPRLLDMWSKTTSLKSTVSRQRMHESHASASFSGETNSFEFGFSAPSGGDRILVFHENEEKKRSVQLSWEGGGELL